jgi:hypothetical protein
MYTDKYWICYSLFIRDIMSAGSIAYTEILREPTMNDFHAPWTEGQQVAATQHIYQRLKHVIIDS